LLWLQSDADPRVVDNIATKPGTAVPIPAVSASTEVVERSSPDWPAPVVSVPDGSASDGLAPFDVSASAVATVHSVQASDSIPTRGRQLRVAAKTPKSEPSAALTKAAVPEAMASSLPSTSSPAYPPPPPDTLGAEFEMLREARKLLATNPRSALDWLEEHQRSYPDGKLEFQREILVIDALVAMDRVSEAAKRAEALQERVRGTPYETRLAKMIADVWGF